MNKKYVLETREVVMFGDYVGVCRNGTWKTTVEEKNFDNKIVITKTKSFVYQNNYQSEYYIDFIDIRETEKGDYYEDENSPVSGGLLLESAKRVLEELQEAVKYIENLTNE